MKDILTLARSHIAIAFREKESLFWFLVFPLFLLTVLTLIFSQVGQEEDVHFVSTKVFLRQVSFPVKVVVVKTALNPLTLVCSSETICAEDIIQLYAARFSIETAIEQMKGSLGWCDYQCYTPVAFHRFVNLICFAASW